MGFDGPIVGDPSGPIDQGNGLAAAVIADLLAAFEALVAWVAALINFIWGVLVAVANLIWKILTDLGTFFYHLWDNYIFPFLQSIAAELQKIYAAVKRFVQPVLNVIQRIQKWYNVHIAPIVKVINEILSRVRVVLGLLKLAGVKWAAKLDQDIQIVQNYITTFTNDVIQTLNAIASTLQFALDPFSIVRRDFFTGSLFSAIGPVKRAAGYGNDRTTFPTEQTHIDEGKAVVFSGQPSATFDASGNMTPAPAVAATDTQIGQRFSAAGIKTFEN